jgi:hypothetical protein
MLAGQIIFSADANGANMAYDTGLFEYVGSGLWTDIRDVVVDRNYAYCAMANGLVILDISDPANPQKIGSLYCPGTALELVKSGNIVFLADGPAGMFIIDVFDPSQPKMLSNCRTGYNREVFVYDGLVYALSDSSYIGSSHWQLDIINVDDPSKPVLVGKYGVPEWGIQDLFVEGSYAFICEYDNLLILDISDLSQPVPAGAIGGFYPNAIHVMDTLAYVLIAGFLKVINVADPIHPQIIGEVTIGGWAIDLDIRDSLAYVTSTWPDFEPLPMANCNTTSYTTKPREMEAKRVVYDGGVNFSILNIADPSIPTKVSESNICGAYASWHSGLTLRGDRLFHTGYSNLLIYDISNPSTPEQTGIYETPGPVTGVRIQDGFAYVNCLREFYMLDISDPYNPIAIAQIDSASVWKPEYEPWGNMLIQFLSMAIDNDRLAILSRLGTIWIVDIADPSYPAMIGDYWIKDGLYPSYTYDVIIQNDLLYVSGDRLYVFDISDGSMPNLIGSIDSRSYYALTTRDSYAYGIGPANFGIFNITDACNPVHIGEAGGGCTEHSADGGLVLRDTLAYASFCQDLKILNISNPSVPYPMGKAHCSYGSLGTWADDIFLDDTLVYAAWGWLGIGLINVADPANPYVIGRHATAGWSLDITGEDGLLYIADESSLLVFKTGDAPTDVNDDTNDEILPDAFSLAQNYPNPFNPATTIKFSLSRLSEVRLEILNIIGQKVTTLIDGKMPAGEHSIQWDGKESGGDNAATGIYFYQICTDDYVESKKMILLK